MLIQTFDNTLLDELSFEASSGGTRQAPIAFLDRDGVINANRVAHVTSWEDFEFLPGSLEAIAILTRLRWMIVVVTNQASINRGHLVESDLAQIHHLMVSRVREHGGHISAVFSCPHRPDEGCNCRKPEPGMLVAAATRHGASLRNSILVGDHVSDIEAARRAGCQSVLVLSGRYRLAEGEMLPDNCVATLPDLLGAAEWIARHRTPRVPDLGQSGFVPC